MSILCLTIARAQWPVCLSREGRAVSRLRASSEIIFAEAKKVPGEIAEGHRRRNRQPAVLTRQGFSFPRQFGLINETDDYTLPLFSQPGALS